MTNGWLLFWIVVIVVIILLICSVPKRAPLHFYVDLVNPARKPVYRSA